MRGILFAKQFPNPAEPLRGLFVAEQMRVTSREVDWRVIAPMPYVPRVLASPLRKPWAPRRDAYLGASVERPRYLVLPRRMLYATAGASMASASAGAFRRAREQHRPEFAHVHALYPSGAALRRLATEAGLPYVVTIHGSDLYSNLARKSWRRELEAVVKDAAAVVCVSRSLAHDAVLNIGADPAKTFVVPDTFDSGRFRLIERGQRGGRLRLIAVGRLVPVKGFDSLIVAMGRAVSRGADVELTIVGQGPEEGALRETVARERVVERVRFAGPLHPDDLHAELAAADVFVSPSQREGFGVAIVEALATGLPAIATRCGGPEDIVTGADGMLVEPGDVGALADAIGQMAASARSYDPAGIAARALARYGPEPVSAALIEIYRALAEGRPASSLEVTRA